MENNSNKARQENRKALPKFLAIMVVSLLLGGGLGYGLAALGTERFGALLATAGQFFAQKIAGWLLIALPVVELAVCVPIYLGAKKQLAAWDGEDESVSSAVEDRLSLGMWVVGIEMILSFFLIAALGSGLMTAGKDKGYFLLYFAGAAAFLVSMVVEAVLQQKLVDLTKGLYPEKRGSVYDTKFSKKWYESCDEAERQVIGQCAFKAYQAMSKVCVGLWLVFTLGGMFLDWGFLPALAVCIVWGVGMSVYCYWAIRKPGLPAVP